MKIIIMVPAYNEESNITQVIESLHLENPEWDILIINDGSSDHTGAVAEKTGKAFVVNLPCNLGIGGAVQTGLKFASRNGYDIAVQCDGDGQHKASEIHKLLYEFENSTADVVVGSRFCEKNDGFKSTFMRRFGIRLFMIVNSLLIRQMITDNTSGFRAYNKKAIRFLADNYATDFPEPESIVLLSRNGFIIKEVYTLMQERTHGCSTISGSKSLYYMLKVLLAVLMVSLRPRLMPRE